MISQEQGYIPEDWDDDPNNYIEYMRTHEDWNPRNFDINNIAIEFQDKTIEKIEQIIAESTNDSLTGELIIHESTEFKIDITERIKSQDELKEYLANFGWTEDEYAPLEFVQGGKFGLEEEALTEILNKYRLFPEASIANQPQNEIFRLDQRIILPRAKLELITINSQLVDYISKHPDFLYSISPRKFEELVCELFRDMGYDVILTPKSRDGGVDIRAIHKSSIGTLLYLVECKHYHVDHPVGVDIVRALYGVVSQEKASHGIIATTSHFTKGAKEFANSAQYQLSLRDYADLNAWIKHYGIHPSR